MIARPAESTGVGKIIRSNARTASSARAIRRHDLVHLLEHATILEDLLEVDLVDLLLEHLEHLRVLLRSLLDLLHLIINLHEDLLAEQLFHVDLTDNNLDPGRRRLVLHVVLICNLKHQTTNVKALITLASGGSC